jgi:putative ABC transport system permease protein
MLRKILVIFQFSLSVLLMISTLVVSHQLRYIRSKDLGFSKNNLVYLPMNEEIHGHYESFRNELFTSPGIISLSRSSVRPGTGTNYTTPYIEWEGKDPEIKLDFHIMFMDTHFTETLGMEIVRGRAPDDKHASDESQFLINETAARLMGLQDPIGTEISAFERTGIIMGVVRDFHLKSVHAAFEPVLIPLTAEWHSYILVRISPQNIERTLASLENAWKKMSPGFPFEYAFLDERIDDLYESEGRMEQILKGFSFLALFLSCLGLLGLAAFLAERRTKEVGIRKVLGASSTGLFFLLSKEFTKWILLSNIIAWPLAYLCARHWLQGFAFRAPLKLWVFVLSGSLGFVIVYLTVACLSLRSARSNPVDSLRHE